MPAPDELSKSAKGNLEFRQIGRLYTRGAEPCDWEARNFDIEIARAIAMGADGFSYDILEIARNSPRHWQRLPKVLDSASRMSARFNVDFRIMLMLDMLVDFGPDKDVQERQNIVSMFSEIIGHRAIYRIDGKPVVLVSAIDRRSPEWLVALYQDFEKAGISIVPWTLSFDGDFTRDQTIKARIPLYGTTIWGPRTRINRRQLTETLAKVHALGLKWMAPIAPQDSRPKSLTMTESHNSEAYRAMWEAAIDGGSDMAHVITWNDFSENTHVQPSAHTGTAFYDLTAYYAAWFKQGQRPEVKRETLY